ncbi:MAG: 2Fe-2S iron-sulfur cluster-binding protein [Pseudomonadota bacterium]
MAQFYPLTVTDVQRDTRDAVVVTLTPDEHDAQHFAYSPGQYLTLRKTFDGNELRRSYSICASAKDKALRVGIKRVRGGWFSSWANESLAPGERIEAMPPAGRFCAPLDATEARNYLLFAIGSGITPILSVAKSILETEPHSRIILTYANRAFNTIMFREALSDLKDLYLDRLTVLHVLKNDAGDIDLLNGRIDADKLDALFRQWMDPRAADLAYICGPQPLMEVITERLEAAGMERSRIRFELFASTPAKRPMPVADEDAEAHRVKASVILDGQTRSFPMRRGETFLDAALKADVELPFSCRGGVCSTCCARVVTGEVEMQTNYALEDYEVDRGLVLTCQALALSDELTISFDDRDSD